MCLKNKIILHLNKNSREEKSNDRSQWWQIVKESAAGKVLSVEERNGRRFWGGACLLYTSDAADDANVV